MAELATEPELAEQRNTTIISSLYGNHDRGTKDGPGKTRVNLGLSFKFLGESFVKEKTTR